MNSVAFVTLVVLALGNCLIVSSLFITLLIRSELMWTHNTKRTHMPQVVLVTRGYVD